MTGDALTSQQHILKQTRDMLTTQGSMQATPAAAVASAPVSGLGWRVAQQAVGSLERQAREAR